VAVADVDQDGVRDLLVTNKLTGAVGVLRGLGGGSFAPPDWSRAGTGLYAVTTDGDATSLTTLEATAGVAAGRFTRGGLADLVAINPGSNPLDLLAGLGQGRFANPVALQTRHPVRVVRVEDFNGDGVLDLAVLTAADLSVYLADGTGGFDPPVAYDAGPD